MAKQWKVVHRGTVGSSEVFAHGHWLDTSDVETLPTVIAAVDAARAALFTTPVLAHYHTSCTWTGADVYQMDLQTNNALDHGVSSTAYAGTAPGSTILPHEVAEVLSLRTLTLTRSGRGRMYLPAPNVNAVDATGQWTSANRTLVVNAWKAYFDSLNGPVGTSAVIRGLVAVGSTVYTVRPITTIDVGSIPDAQRRRRNALSETRTSASITP